MTQQTYKSPTWWLIPLSKWVITPVINGIFVGLIHWNHWGYNPRILSGMNHQVIFSMALSCCVTKDTTQIYTCSFPTLQWLPVACFSQSWLSSSRFQRRDSVKLRKPQLERNSLVTRPGKHTKNYGKSPCLMGKSTISMAIFNSYFNMTRG